MADIVHAAPGVRVIRTLDIVAAHVRGFGAERIDTRVGRGRVADAPFHCVPAFHAIGCSDALLDLLLAAANHGIGEFRVVVDCVVVRFDAVGVVYGEFGVVLCLHYLRNDPVADAERIEIQRVAGYAAVGYRCILVVEVFEEGWAVVPAVRFRPEVEFFLAIHVPGQAWEPREEALHDVPGGHGGNVRGVDRTKIHRVKDRPCAVWFCLGGVQESTGHWIEASVRGLLVREAHAYWLAQKEHVRDVIPRVGIDHALQVRRDSARSKLLEKPYQRVRAGTAVEPEGQRVRSWIIAGLEEPEEEVHVGRQVDVA